MRLLSPTSGYRERTLKLVNARYETYLAGGFPTADFEGQPEPETLQCRNELDRTNWLGLVVSCQIAIALEAGEFPISEPGLRCTSNRMYVVTYNDALSRMLALLGLVQAAQANWWRLKDVVRACERLADLEAINLDEGWP